MRTYKAPIQAALLSAVLVIGAVLVTQTAVAGIQGSVHDIDGYAGNPGAVATDSSRICVACHAPHNGQGATDAPLWNHDVSVAATFTGYPNTATIQATDLGLPGGISLLCLSCHDGATALDAYGTGTQTVGADANAMAAASTALMGVNLIDDHPVSFTFDNGLFLADGELFDPVDSVSKTTALGGTIDNDLLFGAKLECASCHDVHNGPDAVTNGKLLRISNTSSGLCLTCHNK